MLNSLSSVEKSLYRRLNNAMQGVLNCYFLKVCILSINVVLTLRLLARVFDLRFRRVQRHSYINIQVQ